MEDDLLSCDFIEIVDESSQNTKQSESLINSIFSDEVDNFENDVNKSTEVPESFVKHGTKKETLYRCDKCSFVSTFQANYKRHLRNIHDIYLKEKKSDEISKFYEVKKPKHLEVRGKTKTYHCTECGFQTRYPYNFKNHLRRIHDRDQNVNTEESFDMEQPNFEDQEITETKVFDIFYKCAKCDFQSTNTNHYEKHLEENHNISDCDYDMMLKNFKADRFDAEEQKNVEETLLTELFLCSNCDFQTSNVSGYEKHVENVHKIDGENTENEEKVYTSDGEVNVETLPEEKMSDYQEFVKSVMKNSEEDAENKGTQYTNIQDDFKQDEEQIIIETSSEELYQCNMCKFQSSSMSDYKKHVKNKHNKKLENKNVEQEETKHDKNDFIKQQVFIPKTLKIIPEFEDNITDNFVDVTSTDNFKIRNSAEEMKMDIMKSEKSYSCNKCDFQTRRKDNLDSHIKVMHTFKCDKCSFRSDLRIALKNHIKKKHPNEDNPKTDDDKSKVVKAPLEKNILCSKCSFKTAYKHILKRHLLNVHNPEKERKRAKKEDLPFQCANCEYRSKKKLYLSKHIVRMHMNVPDKSEKIFKCDYCPLKCKRKYDIQKHIERMHQKQKKEPNQKKEERKYECFLCPHFQTDYEEKYNRHLKCVHKADVDCTVEFYEQIIPLKNVEKKENTEVNKAIDEKEVAEFDITKVKQENLSEVRSEVLDQQEPSKSVCEKETEKNASDLSEPNQISENQSTEVSFKMPEKNTTSGQPKEIFKNLSTQVPKKLFQCKFCDFKSSYPANYRRHLTHIHNTTRKYLEKNENNKKAVKTERQSISKDDYTIEKICVIKGETKIVQVPKENEVLLSRRKTYKCEKCDYQTKFNANIKRHYQRHHNYEILKCSLCSYETKSLYRLKFHIAQHSKNIDGNLTVYKCDQCEFQTTNNKNLPKHVKHVHGPKDQVNQFSCKLCDYKTVYHINIKKHLRTQHYVTTLKLDQGKKDVTIVFNCAKCDYKTDCRANFVRHVNGAVHRPKDIKKFQKCKHCRFKSRFKKGLDEHLMKAHRDKKSLKTFVCFVCYAKFPTNSELIRHKLSHLRKMTGESRKIRDEIQDTKPSGNWKCEQCSFESDNKNIMFKHVKKSQHGSVDQLRTNLCYVCGAKFFENFHLTRHIERMHSKIQEKKPKPPVTTKKFFQCASCKYKTDCKEDIVNHMKSEEHHKNVAECNEQRCDQCSFKSKYKTTLLKHLKTVHGSVETYLCPFCYLKFSANAKLLRHLKNCSRNESAITQKFFECTPCRYKTESKNDIVEHFNSERHKKRRGRRVYKAKDLQKCEKCSFTSFWKECLRRHMKNIHGQKMQSKLFKCNVCIARFLDKPQLEEHRLKHLNELVKKCEDLNML